MTIKPTLTKDNIEDYIREGIIYESNTPSGWAMMHFDTDHAGFVDDPLSFAGPVDLPEVEPLLIEAKAARQKAFEAERDAFLLRFEEMTKDLLCIHNANFIDGETRDQYRLYEYIEERTTDVARAQGRAGFWYHGQTQAMRLRNGRVNVTYGGCFDIWVPRGDIASDFARQHQ